MTDINECDNVNGGCEQNCINDDGSYTCSCTSGFRLSTDCQNCTGMPLGTNYTNHACQSYLDINECHTSNGGCHHNCINTIGSYACQCNEGFTSTNNGEYCSGK